jgi:hypothetical protein
VVKGKKKPTKRQRARHDLKAERWLAKDAARRLTGKRGIDWQQLSRHTP